MINVGVVGYGYWGPNVVRNFNAVRGAEVVAICDQEEQALSRAGAACPKIPLTRNCREVLESPKIDAVVIVTPVGTHYDIARKALENGKHIFIEKPFTASTSEAEELVELAGRKGLKIMVDHTFLFTGAVRKIKELIDEGTLGDLYYFDSTRVNLGLFQRDVNVVWDLAPHDLAIMDYLFGEETVAVAATGISHFDNDQENVAYITVYLTGNRIAHINVNWLSPVKIRMTLIGGRKKMVVWNDLVNDEKLRVYDRGVEPDTKENSYPLRVSYRSGDMWAPRVETSEALRDEAEYFVSCINQDAAPFNDGESGLRVVRLLEAIVRSLKRKGEVVYL